MANSTAAITTGYQNITPFSIPAMQVDGVQGQKTCWSYPDAQQNWGYFNAVPDLKSAITLKAIWNVGKGYQTDPDTMVLLDNITGWGKETFADILYNMEVNRLIHGCSFAEIIRGEDGELVNLKVLDTACMTIWVDEKGIIDYYEYRVNGKSIEFQPQDILHLSNNRLSSQIHGISDIQSLEKVILADARSFDELQKVISNQARPFIIFQLPIDDASKLSTHAQTIRDAKLYGNDIIFPVEPGSNDFKYEVVNANPSGILLQWRAELRSAFFRAIGLPQIIPGASGNSTESESKVIYLAFEQIVENSQRYLEGQIWNQLQLRINLIPPTTMSDMLQQDQSKDGAQAFNIQPSDFNVAQGR